MISPTLIFDLRSVSKPKDKQEILKNNDCEFLRYLLKAAYEPFEVYHIKLKSKEIPEPGKFTIEEPFVRESIVNVIEYCKCSNSNKQNRERVLPILEDLTEATQVLLLGTLHKNWKAGISTKLINKTFPGLITEFSVQLANSYLKVIKKKTYKPKKRWCSYKLDGVRCVFLRIIEGYNYNTGKWYAFSRQGKEFLTVDHIKSQLELLWEAHGSDFWDGELYIPEEPFESIQSKVTSFTTGTSYDLEYRAFICGDQAAFLNQIVHFPYKIVEDFHTNFKGITHIKAEKQWLIEEEEIQDELEKAFDLGYEGIMLRDPDKLYDFKRSDALLKLKESPSDQSQEQIADCLVVDYEIDSFAVIENEHTVYKNLLVKLFVEQKNGKICKVGSGFSLAFRYKYTKNPELLLNKVIEVKFQGYGSKGLMRFPRLYRIREDLDW